MSLFYQIIKFDLSAIFKNKNKALSVLDLILL